MPLESASHDAGTRRALDGASSVPLPVPAAFAHAGSQAPEKASASFGLSQLARRVAGRTTDLIVIGLVLIGGLTMGRSIVGWWRAEPAPVDALAAAPGPEPFDVAGTPLRLEFGDSPLSLVRQTVAGNSESVQGRLIEQCRQIAASAPRPAESSPGAAEQTLLAKVDDATRVAGSAADWGVHRVPGGFPLVFGVRRFAAESAAPAGDTRRLVCWGMAFPLSDEQWTVYTFAWSATGISRDSRFPEVQLPEGARRSLAVRDETGGGMIGFSGRGDPDDWSGFFTGELHKAGWRGEVSSSSPDSWSGRFASADASQRGAIEVYFSGSADRGLTGILQMSSP